MIDATNVQPPARGPLIELAARHQRVPVAIVFDLPERLCQQWNAQRERVVPRWAVHRQAQDLRGSLGLLGDEGFGKVYVLHDPAEIGRVVVCLVPAEG